MASSDVRLQWDPDHNPYGERLERRAIQLGLRGETLAKFGREWIVRITDVTDFVHAQRIWVKKHDLDKLKVPIEEVYKINSPALGSFLLE